MTLSNDEIVWCVRCHATYRLVDEPMSTVPSMKFNPAAVEFHHVVGFKLAVAEFTPSWGMCKESARMDTGQD